MTCKGPRAKRVWALDADLAAAFDKIDHDRLLEALGSFPARDLIRDWLKAGVFEAGKGFAPTEEGTPQGGVISPLLLNVALHGLEEAAGVRYVTSGRQAGETQDGIARRDPVRRRSGRAVPQPGAGAAGQGAARRVAGAQGSGLQRGQDQNRAPRARASTSWGSPSAATAASCSSNPARPPSGGSVAGWPSRCAHLRGSNAQAVLATIVPIVRGWAAYYRGVVSKEVFASLDDYMWKLTYKWAKYSHANKPKSWIIRPVLRPVQPRQAGPVGVRRPRQRCLPTQVRLDKDRPAPHGARTGVA